MRERSNVSSSELTTFKIGGNARIVYEPENLESLIQLTSKINDFHIIGNGSNVVFCDNGINKPIIRLKGEFSEWYFVDKFTTLSELKKINQQDNANILCYAGCSLMRLSSLLSNYGYTGLEFAAGIPGTIGGAVMMNAGAHGHEISEIIEVVYLLKNKQEISIIKKSEINFSYRSTDLEGVVVAAGINLKSSDKKIVSDSRKSCLEYRKNTQPLTMPSAGSVFVNIKEEDGNIIHAAKLIESVGLKGEIAGGIQISPLHSNWLVKISEEAKASDFINLVNKAIKLVKEKYGIVLKTEIKFWDE